VELEFKTEGEFKNFSGVDLRFGEATGTIALRRPSW